MVEEVTENFARLRILPERVVWPTADLRLELSGCWYKRTDGDLVVQQ